MTGNELFHFGMGSLFGMALLVALVCMAALLWPSTSEVLDVAAVSRGVWCA